MAKFGIAAVLGVLAVLIAVILIRTLTFGTDQLQVKAIRDLPVDTQGQAHRLARSLGFETVSGVGNPNSNQALAQFHGFLKSTFPATHSQLQRETVNTYSLLYTWRGTHPTLKPILLIAHMDVVPAADTGPESWTHPPFEGAVDQNFIWGRGALDMKQSLMAMFEAIELLVARGFAPARTVYLALGHDEEVGGARGAAEIASLLRARGVKLAFTLDEGSAILSGILPGIDQPVPLIGIAEKGMVNLSITVTGPGGHGAMPPPRTVAGQLAGVIDRVETYQMPMEIRPPFSEMFEYLGPHMAFIPRMLLANRWLFQSVLTSRLAQSNATNASIRTTTAITMLNSGVAYNVLPVNATAIGNFRILPGDSVRAVVDHVEAQVLDENATVQQIGAGAEPSKVSATDAPGFTIINKTIREVFPDTLVAPGLVVTATDSRHYEAITENAYRFVPMRLQPEDVQRIHGKDERISIQNYDEIIRFYVQLLQNASGAEPSMPGTILE